MFDIRENIKNALAMVGMTPYKFCKQYGFELSNVSAFLNSGKKTLSVEQIQKIMSILTDKINGLKRYLIEFEFFNGDVANVQISAENEAEAVERIKKQPEFVKFAGQNAIKNFKCSEVAKGGINPENFLLQKSETPNFWVVTDLRFNVVVKFEQGNFDNRKNTVLFEKELSNLEIETSLRQIGEFLSAYHSELL